MRLRDCILLGSAKLRLRRRRTVVSCLTVSLLFGVVVMMLTVCGAFFGSLAKMSGEVFDGKIYVEVGTYGNPEEVKAVWDRAMELYEASDVVGKKNPILNVVDSESGEVTYSWLDRENEFAKVAIREYYEQSSVHAADSVGKAVADYGGRLVPSATEEFYLGNGRVESEVFWKDQPGTYVEVFHRDVLKPFIGTTAVRDDAVSVVITDVEAGKLLGVEGLRGGAPRKERYEKFLEVRERALGMTFVYTVVNEDEENPEVSTRREVKCNVVGVFPAGGGLIPERRPFEQNIFTAFFDMLSTSGYRYTLMPEDFKNEYFLENYQESFGGIRYVAEFDDVEDVIRYMEYNRCTPDGCKSNKHITELITNQAKIYSMDKNVNTVAAVAALFFGIIALVILIGVFSRIIAEERQATAIFRAVGASKWDIRKIYLVYALMLSGITAILAVVMGLVGAAILHFVYSSTLTYGARAMYGLVTDSRVWLVGFDVRVLLVVAAVVVIGMLCALAFSDKMVTKSIVNDLRE